MKKYIGTKPADAKSQGNKGDIWTEVQKGIYECIEGKHKGLKLKEDLIQHDIRMGYLKPAI